GRRSRPWADGRAGPARRACGLVEGRGGGVPAPAAGRSCARYASLGTGGGPSRRRSATSWMVMWRPRAFSTSKKAPRRATTVNTPGTWRCTTRSPIWMASSLTAAELAGRRVRLQGDVASPRTTPHNARMLLGVRRFSALAALVARIYGGYKLIQLSRGFAAARGDGARL